MPPKPKTDCCEPTLFCRLCCLMHRLRIVFNRVAIAAAFAGLGAAIVGSLIQGFNGRGELFILSGVFSVAAWGCARADLNLMGEQ